MDVTRTIDPTETLAEHMARPVRSEAEARAKREADHAARGNLQLEQMQFNRLFGGIK